MPYLDRPGGHSIYYEVHGAPEGKPAVVLHGGPGGGLQRSALRFFDLRRWRVVLFDQRGCGRSVPSGTEGLRNNTTPYLVEDIEALRRLTVGESPWTVFGGSWGSTLALAYYAAHPTSVAALILRGICLMTREEQRWLYEADGAAQVFPAEWAAFARGQPQRNYRRLTRSFHRRLRSRDRTTRRRAAQQWWGWESALSHLRPVTDRTPPRVAEDLSRLETHYFAHDGFVRSAALLAAARRIPRTVPVWIIHGRYDMVCPVASAYLLHEAIPHSRLVVVPDAGHAASEPWIARALKRAVREVL
jgi:proline iminopeptidase